MYLPTAIESTDSITFTIYPSFDSYVAPCDEPSVLICIRFFCRYK